MRKWFSAGAPCTVLDLPVGKSLRASEVSDTAVRFRDYKVRNIVTFSPQFGDAAQFKGPANDGLRRILHPFNNLETNVALAVAIL